MDKDIINKILGTPTEDEKKLKELNTLVSGDDNAVIMATLKIPRTNYDESIASFEKMITMIKEVCNEILCHPLTKQSFAIVVDDFYAYLDNKLEVAKQDKFKARVTGMGPKTEFYIVLDINRNDNSPEARMTTSYIDMGNEKNSVMLDSKMWFFCGR